MLLPRYRLSTVVEWEFAVAGLIGNLQEGTENIDERRIYPWDGHCARQDEAQFTGQIRANSVRGRGDYMVVAGHLNDGDDVTAPVEYYWPNDYGLYNMAGNVSKWVMDIYRLLTSDDYDEFRNFIGNVFKKKLLNSEGNIEIRNQQVLSNVLGMEVFLNDFERVRFQRVSVENHDPNDPVIPYGISAKNQSKHNLIAGHATEPNYVSKGKVKDEALLKLLRDINEIIDQAVEYANDKFDIETSSYIQSNLF